MYRLLNSIGVFTYVNLNKANDLISSGEWVDVTKYENEEHKNERQPILKNKKCEAKESGKPIVGRQADGLQRACNTETDRKLEASKTDVLLEKDVKTEVKKKRGRPRKT